MFTEHLAILLLVAANGLSHPGYVHQTAARPDKALENAGAAAPTGTTGTVYRNPYNGKLSWKKARPATLSARGDGSAVSP